MGAVNTLTGNMGAVGTITGNMGAVGTFTASLGRDTSKPSFVSAEIGTVAQNKVVRIMSEVLSGTAPAASAFSVSGITGTPSVSAVSIATKYITLTLSCDALRGETITVSYTKPVNNPLRDATGNETDSFINQAVTNNVTNRVKNSGLGTDWVDSNSDGVADGWTKQTGAGTHQIVTGNGFTGNAQRINHVTGTMTQFQYYDAVNDVTSGKTYNVTGKYRASVGCRIYLRGTADALTLNMGTNTGNAASFTFTAAATATQDLRLNFYILAATASGYVEIDEVRLKQTD